MSERPSAKSPGQQREQRLAAALRENLRRRKQQARERLARDDRDEPSAADAPSPPSDPEDQG